MKAKQPTLFDDFAERFPMVNLCLELGAVITGVEDVEGDMSNSFNSQKVLWPLAVADSLKAAIGLPGLKVNVAAPVVPGEAREVLADLIKQAGAIQTRHDRVEFEAMQNALAGFCEQIWETEDGQDVSLEQIASLPRLVSARDWLTLMQATCTALEKYQAGEPRNWPEKP